MVSGASPRTPTWIGIVGVVGTLLAQSACETAVIIALAAYRSAQVLRQRMRERLYDGQQNAAPCQVQLNVTTCFALLLRWIVALWQGTTLVLAIDATLDRNRSTAPVVRVLHGGSALPVACAILPANTPGAWMPAILQLLTSLRPAVPTTWQVLVLAGRGLQSPRVWDGIREPGWHPLLRMQQTTTVAPQGRDRLVSQQLVQPGQAWVGRGKPGSPSVRWLTVTLIVVWAVGQCEP